MFASSMLANSQTITAKSWAVADDSGLIIHGENINDQRSIASITKLMTAMLVIDAGLNMNEKIKGFTRAQHIQMALVRSSNESSMLLCNTYPGGRSKCILDMNLKAKAIGMKNTKFVEPSGLSPMNISTAEDLVQLVLAAKYYPEIVQASRTSLLEVEVNKKKFLFKNTNPIIGQRYDFSVSKTGLTTAAGACIVMLLNTGFTDRVVVLLGSKTVKSRIVEAETVALLNNNKN